MSYTTSVNLTRKYHISIALLFFYFVHPFLLKGYTIFSYCVIYGFPAIYMLINYRYTISFLQCFFSKSGLKFVIGFLLICLWTFFAISINETSDYSFFGPILSVLRTLERYMFLSILLMKNCKTYKGNIFETYLQYYIISNILYVLSTLILVSFPSVKSVWFDIIQQSTLDHIGRESIYSNRFSIDGFAGYRSTMKCTLGIVFCLYLITSKFSDIVKYEIFIALQLVGNFFYGRTGLVLSFIAIISYTIRYRYINLRTVLAIGAIILGGFWLYNIFMNINEGFESTVQWATTPIIELLNDGETSSHSYNRLHEMYWIPDNSTLLHGDGYYTSALGNYYMSTDIGFMRQLLFGGLSVCFITYASILYAIFKIFKGRFFSLMFIIIFTGFEFKGESWFSILPLLITLVILKELQHQYVGICNYSML